MAAVVGLDDLLMT